MLLETPTLGPLKVELRPYQDDAIAAVRRQFADGKKSTLLVLPTGTGKTVTFGMMARLTIEKGGKVLVLAHRGELIDQAANTLDLLGVEAAIEKADQYARALYEPDAVIATVQTMRGKRLEDWPRDHFRLIITDEAHHSTADSYQRIYRHFHGAYHLGVTATADRSDEADLSEVFESLAYEWTLWDAMTAPPPGPYLCRLKVVQCDVQIDLRGIRTTGGDFNVADLEERLTPMIDTLANAIRQEIGDRKTLVFTPDIGSAQAMASALASLGLRAEWISGVDSSRADKIARLKSGDIQALCNCALLTEGFDCPTVSAVVLCRPTQSRPFYAQMVGRGTRLAPGKDDCLIVDFAYVTNKHNLVKPVELFDSSHTDSEVLEAAQEIVEKNPAIDLMEAIQRGEKIHEERQVARVIARERAVQYRRVSYDPMAVHDTLGLPWRGRNPDTIIHKATSGQVRLLEKFKVTGADNMSRAKASTLIDFLMSRSRKGLATHKQVAWLIRTGIEPAQARAMTIKDASSALDRVFNKRG